LASTAYYLTETITSTGCKAKDSSEITVNPVPQAGFSYTDVCLGDSTPFSNSSLSASGYSWKFGDGGSSILSNPNHKYASKGTYHIILTATNTYGCADSASKNINVSSCVWPGDANNDKTVDMSDFLAVGIAYGTKGYVRPSATTNWVAQPSKDWGTTFSTGTDYKNADCNGDSIVDNRDTLAIVANYGKSHLKSSILNQGSPTDPGFLVKSTKDTLYAGDTLRAVFSLGTNANQVQNLYGLKLSVNADRSVFDVVNAFVTVNNSFLGTYKTDLMAMRVLDGSTSLWDLGITRTDHKNVSGNGTIATINIPILSTLPQKEMKTALGISDNVQIAFNEKSVPLFFTSDSFLLKQDKSGIEPPASNGIFHIDIYPNPAHDILNVVFQKSVFQTLVLEDVQGRVVSTYAAKPLDNNLSIPLEGLAKGLYLLKAQGTMGFFVKKVIVE